MNQIYFDPATLEERMQLCRDACPEGYPEVLMEDPLPISEDDEEELPW